MLMLVFVGLFCGFWIYCSTREHFLSTLLSLEFMVLMIFIFIFIVFNYSVYYYSLIYLILTACEGALGLSILVILSRSMGGDYFKSFNILINYDKIYFCFTFFIFFTY